MSNYLELPCGCKITMLSLVAICSEHYQQLVQLNIERQKAHAEFVRKFRDSVSASGATNA